MNISKMVLIKILLGLAFTLMLSCSNSEEEEPYCALNPYMVSYLQNMSLDYTEDILYVNHNNDCLVYITSTADRKLVGKIAGSCEDTLLVYSFDPQKNSKFPPRMYCMSRYAELRKYNSYNSIGVFYEDSDVSESNLLKNYFDSVIDSTPPFQIGWQKEP